MATAKKQEEVELKSLPGFSQGVRENSAVRMIKLARPICPHSKITMELDSNGRPVPVKSVGEPNCQLAGQGWWEMCEGKGHDPYFTTRKWYTTEDILETREDGKLVKVGEELIPHEIKLPNVAQVASEVRINNGQGPRRALELKGYKRLRDIGYEEVCQYRNCQKSVTPEGTSRKYGLYCSRLHLSLIAATQEEILLDQPNAALNGPETAKLIRRRERTLSEVLMGA